MGYMGLDSYIDSDNAAGLAYIMQKAMAQALKKGLSEKDSFGFNTEGPENVAMIFESFIIPCIEDYKYSDELVEIANKTLLALQKKIEKCQKHNWDYNQENKKMHINAYKRMAKALQKFIEYEYR